MLSCIGPTGTSIRLFVNGYVIVKTAGNIGVGVRHTRVSVSVSAIDLSLKR